MGKITHSNVREHNVNKASNNNDKIEYIPKIIEIILEKKSKYNCLNI